MYYLYSGNYDNSMCKETFDEGPFQTLDEAKALARNLGRKHYEAFDIYKIEVIGYVDEDGNFESTENNGE